MPDTDAPSPFAEAYQRLTDAQADSSFETRQVRDAIKVTQAAAADPLRKTSVKRRLPKVF